MANKMTREELIKASKDMDPAELIEKLNEDTANFINQLPKVKKEDLWSLEDWDKQLKSHPFFMTKSPVEGEEMSPLVEALQSLKYDPDENTPEELARSYKEDGNENFKRKKYRWAVDSYTEGLKTNCSDEELVVQLYSNRAAAYYYIGNYKKSLDDAHSAKLLNKEHVKALERGALCCFKLNKLLDCISWCEEGLQKFPENKALIELKQKATYNRESERRAQALNAKHRKEIEDIKKVIIDRKINMDVDSLKLDDNETVAPGVVSTKVHLDQDNRLIWPVMILYPEHGTSDYIQEFHEDSVFLDHFKIMFENDSPEWDIDKKYIPEKLQVYFMDDECIVHLQNTSTLRNAVSHKRFKVYKGTPCFFVTVSHSSFDTDLRKKHCCEIVQYM